MVKKYGEIISGAITMIMAVVVYYLSTNIRQFNVVKIGADFVPKVVAVLFFGLGAMLLYQGVKNMKEKEAVTENDSKVKPDVKAVIMTFSLVLVYIVLLEKIGFVIMTCIYLFLQFIIISKKEERHYLQFAVLSLITSAGAFYLFVKVFNVMIPNGILG